MKVEIIGYIGTNRMFTVINNPIPGKLDRFQLYELKNGNPKDSVPFGNFITLELAEAELKNIDPSAIRYN